MTRLLTVAMLAALLGTPALSQTTPAEPAASPEAVRAFQQATDKVPTGIANHHTQLTLQHIYEETYWQDDANFIVRDE